MELHRTKAFENIWSSIEDEMVENTHAHHAKMNEYRDKEKLRERRRELKKQYYEKKVRDEL